MKPQKQLLAILLTLLLSATTILAQTVPQSVNYQGQLSNADGTPLGTSDYKLSFSIYDQPQGGDAIWGPQVFPQVPVAQGYFSVILGPTDTHSPPRPIVQAFDGTSAYVEITVGDKALSPRQQILTAPFAFRADQAGNSAKLNGLDWSAVFGANTPSAGIPGTQIAAGAIDTSKLAQQVIDSLVPAGTIVPFAGDLNKIPQGWLPCNGTNVSSRQYARLFAVIGFTYGRGPILPTTPVPTPTFAVPNLQGRIPLGAGAGQNLTTRQLGQALGAENHTLTLAEIPPHQHGGTTGPGLPKKYRVVSSLNPGDARASAPDHQTGWAGGAFTDREDAFWENSNHQHTFTTDSRGDGKPHDIMPPCLVINYIIKW